jgi:hypothetical protein
VDNRAATRQAGGLKQLMETLKNNLHNAPVVDFACRALASLFWDGQAM